jgi:hypothetical protein
MQSYKNYLQPYGHKVPFAFMKASTFKNKAFVPTPCSTLKNGSLKKYRPTLTLVSSQSVFPSLCSQKLLSPKKGLMENPQVQAEKCISLIEDPLWKRICVEFLAMMGPSSLLKIWKMRLAPLSSQRTIVYLTCQTKEEAEFIQTYSFVILGSLQAYFPAVKRLVVRSVQY